MRRRTELMTAILLVIAALSVSAASAHAQDATSGEATWYFIGDSNSQWSRFDRDSREPFVSLGDLDGTATRREFVLTLIEDPDPERLRFTAGQSLGLAGRGETYTFLVNRSFDWTNSSPITPHFMAGLGMTYTDDQGVANQARQSDAAEPSWRPAFQFGFGASYEISTRWSLVAQYRALVVGADSFNLDGDTDRGFTQNFMIGARINF